MEDTDVCKKMTYRVKRHYYDTLCKRGENGAAQKCQDVTLISGDIFPEFPEQRRGLIHEFTGCVAGGLVPPVIHTALEREH